MTEDPLSVDDLDVVRAPGFESGGFQIDDLCNGVNIVHGPNASGKTTMARSIQWLLWPDDAADRATVLGSLAIDGESWRVDVDHGRAEYQRNGQDANRPSLPPTDQRDRYVLFLHELLQKDTQDETFAEAIQRESAGGYDLPAAIDALDFDDSPTTSGKREVGEAESAVEHWQEARREVEELRDNQRRLPTLEKELEGAREAKRRVELLDQAIDYAETRDDLDEVDEALEDFPDLLHQIDGDEAEDVEELDGRIEEWERKKAEASESLEAAKEKLAEADLPDDGVPDGFIDRVKQRRDKLESLEDRKRDREGSLADYEARRERALEEIPIDVDATDLVAFDTDSWGDITEFAKTAEEVTAERKVREAVDRWLTEPESQEPDESTLDRGIRALEQWLAYPPSDSSSGSGATVAINAATAVLLGISGAIIGVGINPVGNLLVLLAILPLWLAIRALRAGSSDDSLRATHQKTFQGLDLEPPESWTEDAVRERLLELYDAIAKHRIDGQRKERREALLSDVDELDEREAALEERRQELRESLGAAPETSDIELVAATNAIGRWQEAHERVTGQRREIETIEGQIDSEQSDLEDELAPYGYEDVDDSASATEYIRDLESRVQTHDEAKREISDAEETINDAESKLEDLQEERAEIFDQLGLDHDELDRLRSLCDRADEFREAEKAREKSEHLASNEEEAIENKPGYEPELKERSVSELKEEKHDAEETASAYDDVHEQITQIETEIRNAKGANRVEEALTEKERALDALGDQLESDYDSMVGHALAEHVKERTTDANRPAVFEHAREVLARISKGRYRLDLADGDDTFRAYDTIKERGFALDELSSATRLQVLLAVRIAFVERQEQGTRLPILLDETLANTDDGKAEVIIESMLELAREGRQLFYFTAQGDEVARWVAAIDDVDDIDHAVIDLAEAQDLDRHVEVPDLEGIADRPLSPPDSEGHDHDSYGEAIDVPPFDPRRGAGTAHLWYVVEDLDLLHRLLGLGIERWGQLDNLMSNASATAIVDDPKRLDPATCTGAALEEFVRSWQRGRGERVDQDVLDASGAVSGNFIDDVTELAEELDGDGERLIAALRDGQVNRFRDNKTDELEAYLEENGYIESIEPLEPEAIRLRVIDCLVEHDVPREEAQERGIQLLDRLETSAGSS